jgi:hypothetical protein
VGILDKSLNLDPAVEIKIKIKERREAVPVMWIPFKAHLPAD